MPISEGTIPVFAREIRCDNAEHMLWVLAEVRDEIFGAMSNGGKASFKTASEAIWNIQQLCLQGRAEFFMQPPRDYRVLVRLISGPLFGWLCNDEGDWLLLVDAESGRAWGLEEKGFIEADLAI